MWRLCRFLAVLLIPAADASFAGHTRRARSANPYHRTGNTRLAVTKM
jgi:hypothetical protein